MRLDGKVVLVTGGGSGIGEAIVRHAADAGATVVVADVAAEQAERVAGDVQAQGGRALAVRADVSDAADAEHVVARAEEELGSVDVLVNNAGIVRDAQLHKMEAAQWDAVMDVNLTGTVLMCREAAKGMVRRGWGRIVNIASRSLLGNFGQTNYAASKAGVVGLTKSLAIELGPHGVNVNAIAPGYIETPIMRDVPDEVRERAARAAPVRRVGKPEDIAPVVVFLSSEGAGYITGQCLFVCGGRSLGGALEIWS